MSHGLLPPHRQEQREKQGIRLIIEERLVEFASLIESTVNGLINLYEFLGTQRSKFTHFIIGNKQYYVVLLIAVVVVIAMVF